MEKKFQSSKSSKRKTSGFTLIEQLSAIVIIAVVAGVIIPVGIRSVSKADKAAFIESVKFSLDSVEYYLVENNIQTLPDEGVLVSDLKLKNGSQFIGGKVIKNADNVYEAVRITNGKYCASGVKTKLQVEKECYFFDTTAPIFDETKVIVSTKTSKINLIVPSEAITEEESEIKTYTFEITNEDLAYYKKVSTDQNTYSFDGLKNNTEYKIKITLTNQNDLSVTKEIKATTTDIDVPVYSIDKTEIATSKVVTILYPEKQEGFVYSYSIDHGSNWTLVDTRVATITFTENGTVIARVTDGTNYKNASSFTVTGIDNTAPIVSYSIQGGNYNQAQNIVISATDENFDKMEVIVKKNGALILSEKNIKTNTYSVKLDTNGVFIISTRVTDKALNTQANEPQDEANYYYQTYNLTLNYPATLTCSGGRTLSNGSCIYSYSDNQSKCGCSSWNQACTSYNQACTAYNQTCTAYNQVCTSYNQVCTGYRTCQTSACGTHSVCQQCRKNDASGRYVWITSCSMCGTRYYYNTCAAAACGCASYANGSCKTWANGSCKSWANTTCKSWTNTSCKSWTNTSCARGNSCTVTENEYKSYTCPKGGTLSGTTCVF